ncbi:MAG: excisionase [Clostridiales bacterium]|nr:excisionase [Clostridiales bacterium]
MHRSICTNNGERYLMTIEEASSYFRIGENKLRQLANEYKEECVVMNGNRMLIKKKKFEKVIDRLEQI